MTAESCYHYFTQHYKFSENVIVSHYHKFIKECKEALYYFENQPETFYNATYNLAQITKRMYNWERVANLWRQVFK